MWVAGAVAVTGVLVGTILGSRNNSVGLGVIRTVGLVSGAGAVFTHLLPESAESIGFWALVPFTAALAFSFAAESALHVHLSQRPKHDSEVEARSTLELGFGALMAHQGVEGLAMGAIEEASDSPTEALRLLLPLSLHTVPMIAVFVLAAVAGRGVRSGLLRGGLLWLVTLAGIALAERGLAIAGRGEAVISAVVGAILLHALLHVPDARESRSHRIAGAILGSLIVASGLALGHHGPHEHHGASLLPWGVSSAAAFITALAYRRARSLHAHHS